jgi:hypothetical protein
MAQVPDLNGDESEDGFDEAWALYDRQLIDDELYDLFGEFESNVRILMVSDSCHSGTVACATLFEQLASTEPFASVYGRNSARNSPRYRLLPPPAQRAAYQKHRKLYNGVQKRLPRGERTAIGASVVLLSGCQDNQLSSDGDRNGLFTQVLKRVWKDGGFTGGLRAFQKAISIEMPAWQSPNYLRVGVLDQEFERRPPFSI